MGKSFLTIRAVQTRTSGLKIGRSSSWEMLRGHEIICHKCWEGKCCIRWKVGPGNLKGSLRFFDFMKISVRLQRRDES